MLGVGTTVNALPALATPPTVTTTGPVVAPAGTGTRMLAADHVVGVAAVPLNVTMLVPCVAPKLVPVIVTRVATGPLAGARFVTLGVGTTVNVTPVLATPLTVTTTGPVAAPAGTGKRMLAADHVMGAATVPLKVTMLVPALAPKLVPAIVTEVPTGPDVCERLMMLGTIVTVQAKL
jgi:hypothetical protein